MGRANDRFAPGAAGREYCLGSVKLITRYKVIRSRQSDAEGGMAEDTLCPHAPPTDADDRGTKGCSSARRNLLIRSTSGPLELAWKSRKQSVTLQSSTWQSTANFAPAT